MFNLHCRDGRRSAGAERRMAASRAASIISVVHRSRHRLIRSLVALGMFVAASVASGQVYKCTDAQGRTTYSDTACDNGAKPLKLAEDPKSNHTSPTMCAQLLDETHRLDAEADRDARKSKPETADHKERRQKMASRYSERCAGIARAGAQPR
jgi:hypothetical protein